MELSYNQLKKREVINITDGKSYGKIVDLTLSFPSGTLVGITVPGRKGGWFSRIFDRSKLYISKYNIVKIGGDVILVNLNCGETCDQNVTTNKAKIVPPPPPHHNQNPPCDGGCQPSCPPTCPPSYPPPPYQPPYDGNGSGRIDLSDY